MCLNSLKALQSRRAWAECSRRCGWSKSVMDAARDWTAWCESRVEPELPPQPHLANLAPAAHNSNTADSGGVFGGTGHAHALPGVLMSIAAVILAALMAAAAISVVAVKYPGSLRKLRNAAERILRKGGMSSKKANGILGNPSDRAEMRRLARGARRHLKAMRSNVD